MPKQSPQVLTLMFVWLISLFAGQKLLIAGPHRAVDAPAAIPASASLCFIDAKTGQSKELLKLDHQSLGVPVLVDRTLYIASSGKTLFALDPETGNKRWEFKSQQFLFGVVANKKSVFFGAGKSLQALDAATGKLLWTCDGDIPITNPVLADDLIVFNRFDGPVGLDQATGKQRWRLEMQWSYFVFCPLPEGRLCVWKPDEIFVVDTASGKTLWQNSDNQTPGAPGALPSPAVAAGNLVCQLRCSRTDAEDWSLHALDAPGGHLQWKSSLGAHRASGVRTLISPDCVYCVFENTLACVEKTTGKSRWQESMNPIEAGGVGIAADRSTVYIPELGGNLLALDAKTGKRRWLNPPAAVGETMSIRFGGMSVSEAGVFVARNIVRRNDQ